LADITAPYVWFEEDNCLSQESKLLWCYMRMLFFGEFGLQIDNLADETLDALLQVASNRCPVRTLFTKVTFLKLITAFSSFFSATDFIDDSSKRLC
jgi:hypothetical protein